MLITFDPSQRTKVALTESDILSATTDTLHFAVVPSNEIDGLMEIVLGAACTETTDTINAKRVSSIMIFFFKTMTSFIRLTPKRMKEVILDRPF